MPIDGLAQAQARNAQLIGMSPTVPAPSVLEQLTAEKLLLEERLKHVNAALDSLHSNPEVSRVLELVSKVVNRY